MPTAQQYLSQNYPNKEITELNLSGWNENDWKEKPNWKKLIGELDLSEFPNLEKLDCSFNKITSLNLSSCPNLTELKCWDNQLTEIKFSNSQLKLKTFYAWTNHLTEIDWKNFNPENLTHVSISNNNLQEQNIEVFINFTNLEELCLGNDVEERLEEDIRNRFTGSLKSLQNLNKLKKLQIEGTEIEKNFEHLPKDLQVIYWGKEIIIKQLKLNKEEAEQLRKIKDQKTFSKILSEIVANQTKKKLGSTLTLQQKEQIKDLSSTLAINSTHSQKEIVENINNLENLIANLSDRVINRIEKHTLSEKLGVAKNNMEEFLNEWSSEKISELKLPEELAKYEVGFWTAKWVNRVTSIAGGVALVYSYEVAGGWVAIICPCVEEFISKLRENYYENPKSDWDTFDKDAKRLKKSYCELIEILEQEIKIASQDEVDKVLTELQRKVYDFLREYDKNDDGKIDIAELETANVKERFALDLKLKWIGENGKESRLKGVREAIKNLKERMNGYQEDNKTTRVENKHHQDASQLTAVDLDNHFEEKEQLETKIEIPIKKVK